MTPLIVTWPEPTGFGQARSIHGPLENFLTREAYSAGVFGQPRLPEIIPFPSPQWVGRSLLA